MSRCDGRCIGDDVWPAPCSTCAGRTIRVNDRVRTTPEHRMVLGGRREIRKGLVREIDDKGIATLSLCCGCTDRINVYWLEREIKPCCH